MKKEIDLTNFDAVYNNYKSDVVRRVNMVIFDRMDAEEVVSECMIKIWKYLKTYNIEKAQFNTWLFTIVNNQITDYLRKKQLETIRTSEDNEGEQFFGNEKMFMNVNNFVDSEGNEFVQFSGSGSASDKIENEELHDKIYDAFNVLKPKYKQIAVMYYIKEMKYKEIAEVLNVPMGTVKGMLQRATKMLQSNLKPTYTTI